MATFSVLPPEVIVCAPWPSSPMVPPDQFTAPSVTLPKTPYVTAGPGMADVVFVRFPPVDPAMLRLRPYRHVSIVIVADVSAGIETSSWGSGTRAGLPDHFVTSDQFPVVFPTHVCATEASNVIPEFPPQSPIDVPVHGIGAVPPA